jgi:hypothetical protein
VTTLGSKQYLYRGISEALHLKSGGCLTPKTQETFALTVKYGEGIKYGSGARYGSSDINAVLKHQLDSGRFPTSGISTTPVWDRANFYATHTRDGALTKGYIYTIDRELLPKYGVKEYVVSECIPQPCIPEDCEVILVSSDGGPLPQEVIADTKPLSPFI